MTGRGARVCVVIAPDKFTGCLTAGRVAKQQADGLRAGGRTEGGTGLGPGGGSVTALDRVEIGAQLTGRRDSGSNDSVSHCH